MVNLHGDDGSRLRRFSWCAAHRTRMYVMGVRDEAALEPATPGYSLFNPIDIPVLFLHELPRLLQDGVLQGFSPTGDLEHIGYDTGTGEREQ